MTDYEMRKIARLQAEYFRVILKSDEQLLDLIYPPRLMGIDEASRYLGLPRQTLYNRVKEIPHRKVGKRLVFSERDLFRWINKTKEKS